MAVEAEGDVDDYEIKSARNSEAEDSSYAVVTQVSVKQGEHTRDHEWMLELEVKMLLFCWNLRILFRKCSILY